MPNHVTNVLRVVGLKAETRKFFEAIKGKDDDGNEKEIDFNKIIPMPPSLPDTTSDGLCMALEGGTISKYETVEKLIESIKKADAETIENFCKAIRNINEHGFATWYPWACERWGTKWNAYNQKTLNERTIVFDTAWAHPAPIIAALAKKYPNLEFHVAFADEDTGRNFGKYKIQGAKVTAETMPADYTKEAKAMARSIRKGKL